MAKNSKQDSDNYKNNKIAKIGITRNHSGPLPDSETLIKYNQVYPDLAKEIVEMAKKQSEHRQYLEREQVISETKLRLREQLIGGCAIVILIILGFVLILNDKNIAGASAVIIALIGIIYSISYGKNKDK
ncbi:DUF2335 domain-containing protein [Fusobacterium animalis]|uniref:DUF2335 domain-containing protein n=1 Tax=Fusobacterium animalis TaxID=76859 RepID=UPI001C6EED83|nr:DUF2335 domain-containing protein [Fusobacterium animalis]QYR63145.1 DUF2335 domain-containing protein [Fusobacterium animalis]